MSESFLPLFYRSPRPLRAGTDAELSLARQPSYAFAGQAASIPLVAADFKQACKFYPIVFALDKTPWPLALTGLRPDENLFVDDQGNWEPGAYIPAYVRRYPFIFLTDASATNAQSQDLTLGIDEAAPMLLSWRDNPLFVDGRPTEIITKALAFCVEYRKEDEMAVSFATAAAAADLLIEHKAGTILGSGEDVKLRGYQTIDDYRLSLLPKDELLEWRDRGWLQLANCHLVSMANMARMFRRLRRGPA